jgi:hypothetical protein
MKRKIAIAVVVLLVVAVACVLLYPWKRVERREVTLATDTTAVLPASQEVVRERIAKLFTAPKALLPERFAKFMLVKPGEPLFPDDFQLQAHARQDSALGSYAALPSGQRGHDLYLYEPTGDYYWQSEYYCNGEPAKFRCNFLIHLEPAADERTKVEILEFLPRIWVGRHFSLGHSGPGFYYDIRTVEPTVSDRVELLAIIQKSLPTN